METITTSKGEFLFVEVPRYGVTFFENMGYLIYQEPDYKNWVTDAILESPFKMMQFLDSKRGKKQGSDYKRAAIKLPDGNYKFIAVMKSGVLVQPENSQNINEERASLIVGDNGMGCWDNYKLKKDEVYTCKSAIDSFNCLIFWSQHTLKPDCNYAILKRM